MRWKARLTRDAEDPPVRGTVALSAHLEPTDTRTVCPVCCDGGAQGLCGSEFFLAQKTAKPSTTDEGARFGIELEALRLERTPRESR